MTDFQRDSSQYEQLAAAMRAQRIAGPEEFRKRYGIVPATLNATAALTLVKTPAWVREIWLPNSGATPVLYVPQAVRAFAAVYGITQDEGESDHAFNNRLTVAIRHVLAPEAA